jgi:hypothetical protein
MRRIDPSLTWNYRQVLALVVKYVYTDVNLCLKEDSRGEKHKIEAPGILLHAASIKDLARVLARAAQMRCPIVGIGVGTVKVVDVLGALAQPDGTSGCSHIVCYGVVLDSDAQKVAINFKIPVIHLCWHSVEHEMDSGPFRDLSFAFSEIRPLPGQKRHHSLDLLRTSSAFYNSPLLNKAAWREVTALHGSWDRVVKFAGEAVLATGQLRSQARWFSKVKVNYRIDPGAINPSAQLWLRAFPRLTEMTVQLWPSPGRAFTHGLPEHIVDSFRSCWKARENIVVTPLEIAHFSAKNHLTTLLDEFSRLGWLVSFIFYPCRLRGLQKCDEEQSCGWPNDIYYGLEPFDSRAWRRFSPFAGGHIMIKFYSPSHASFEAEQARMVSNPFLASCDWTVQVLEPLTITSNCPDTLLKQKVTGYQSCVVEELASDLAIAELDP